MTPEDDLLRDLGKLARERSDDERRRLGAEWDRLASGELTPKEEAALAERAARSPEGAAALAAFRPLGEGFQARAVAALRAQRSREQAPAAVEPPPDPAVPPPDPAEAPPAPAPPPLAWRPAPRLASRRRAAAWVTGLAAAGLAGLLLVRPGQPLPPYAGKLGGGTRPERGTTGAPSPVYAPGSPFELDLRPATAVAGDVQVRCLIARAGAAPGDGVKGAARDWPPCAHAERAAEGAFRVRGTVGGDIPFQPGEWDLWVIVSRAGPPGRWARAAMPGDAELLRLRPGAARAGRGWSALRLPEPIRFAAG